MNATVTPSKKNVEEILSLTPLQEGMLFHYLKSPDDNLYFEQLCLYLSGKIDLKRFREAWEMVIETNEMLRTVFRWNKLKRPVQIVLKSHSLQFRNHDISAHPPETRIQVLEEIKNNDRSEPFDLRQVPFRVTLCKESRDRHHLIISNHHILYDGWSTGIILEEFFKTYDILCSGSRAAMRGWVKTRFRSFIHWYQNRDNSAQEQFWNSYLAGYEGNKSLALIANTNGPATPGQHRFRLGPEGRNRINRWVQKERVTQAAFFYSVWGILLQRYSDRGDVIFGTTVSGRNADIIGIEKIVGLFINTVPLRVKEAQDIRATINGVNRELRERHPHENTALVDINRYTGKEGNFPLFDSLVVIENYPVSSRLSQSSAGLSVLSYSMTENTGYDLTLGITLMDELEDIEFEFLYPGQRFDHEAIQRLSRHFMTIIGEIISHPTQAIHQIEILTEAERLTLLETFNNTTVEFQHNDTIPARFDLQADKTPDAAALVGKSGDEFVTVTYKELKRNAHLLARRLRARGIRENTLTGLLINRSVEMLTAILAIMRAGGAYLPIDPDYPRERIRFILADSSLSLLIGSRAVIEENKRIRRMEDKRNTGIIFCESFNKPASRLREDIAPDWPRPRPEHLAYVIYTSGSTGRPKGVMVEHRNLSGYVNAFLEEFSIGQSSVVVQQASYAFDTFSEEVYPVLVKGGKLVVPSRDDVRDIYRFANMISTHSVTVVDCSPLLLDRLNQPVLLPHLSSVQCFISGGDVLRGEYVNRLLETGEVYNTYGPTETTVCATYFKCRGPVTGGVPIGSPIANYNVYILDRHSGLTPLGVPGELCVGGAGVTRGYLNRPGLTADKYVNYKLLYTNSHTSHLSGKGSSHGAASPLERNYGRRAEIQLYRTGDLACWLPDGTLMFLGRLDSQVNIRGFRIELGEIENRLLSYPYVSETVVTVREDRRGDPYICAYIVCTDENENPGCIREQLRGYLAAGLPAYMLPSFFVKLDRIPLNTSGKPDRAALPAPEKAAAETNHIPPRNEREEKLARIWAEVLDVEISAIGIDTDFFQAGGHSLKAVSMVAAIHKEMDVLIPLALIFQAPTIRKLAPRLKKTDTPEFEAIETVEKKEYYPLSSAQKRLYFLKRMAPQSTGYNMTEVLEVKGLISHKRLEERFLDLIQRHESLRTSFIELNGHPVQRIHDSAAFQVELIDAGASEQSNWPPSAQWLSSLIKPFELSRAPLIRVLLIRFKPGRHLLIVDIHHIISDGASVEILIRDFMHFRATPDVSHLPVQYKDYSEWRNRQKKSGALKSQESYWLNNFSNDIPVMDLPLDFPRPRETGGKGNILSFSLSAELTAKLAQMARSQGVTMYMLLLAVFNIFLAKISGQDTVVLGTPVAGRRHADLKPVVGMFVNTLPLKNYPRQDVTISDFLKQLKARTLDAFENQDYPYEELVENAVKTRDAGRNPLFDVMFSLETVENIETRITDWQLAKFPFHPGTSKFDLSLDILKEENNLTFQLVYRLDLFKIETIQRFLSYLKVLTSQIIGDGSREIGELSILPDEERRLILYSFNAADSPMPAGQTVLTDLERQMNRTPDRLALTGVKHGLQVSYSELDRRSARMARALMARGAGRERIIAIKMKRSVEIIIAILAVLRSGSAYLPIDPEMPQERIQYILEDSMAVLTIEAVLPIDDIEPGQITDEAAPPGTATPEPADAAYIIYTSGSTGKPKGVIVEHGNLAAYIRAFFREFEINGQSIVLQQASFVFDAFAEEMYPVLMKGGKLVIPEKQDIIDIQRLAAIIRGHAVSMVDCTPLLLAHLNHPDIAPACAGVELFISGGDVLNGEYVNHLARHGKVYNTYGPTEATVCATYYRCQGQSAGAVPIGKPIASYRTLIVDKNLRLQPIGIAGELCIGGPGVARGYLNKPELTAEKFIPFTLHSSLSTVYKTGDLTRWLPDGNIEFLGRVDFQVKIRGFRIETGEIEHQLLKHSTVDTAVVIARQDQNKNKYLCAYLVPARPGGDNSGDINAAGLRQYLENRLPGYMVPSYFVRLKEMPLTATGKVNRRALPEPETGPTISYVPPDNALEKQLVDLWAGILDMKPAAISVQDSFFILGGHSLSATVMVSRIHKILNCIVPLSEVFTSPTIRALARYIQNRQNDRFLPIEPGERKEYYPLSPAQKQLYVLYLMNEKSTNYNMSVALELEGHVQRIRLEATVYLLLLKHESMRTSFFMNDDVPVQKIHRHIDFEVEYYDHPIAEVIENFIRPFDLGQVPLFRVGLLKIKKDKHLLLVDMHHIISDGVSTRNMIRDFINLYQGAEPEQMRLRYRDYCQWLLLPEMKSEIKRQESFWLNQFPSDIPLLDLPADFPRPVETLTEGRTVGFHLDEEQSGKIKKTAIANQSTLYMILLCIYNVFLSKLSNQQDIVIGTPIAGRRHADLEPVIGLFINTLAMRNRLDHGSGFNQFLSNVRQNAIAAFENQDYPFEDLVEHLTLDRENSRNPLFDTMFSVEIVNLDKEAERLTDLTIKHYPYEFPSTKFDMVLTAMENNGRLELELEYATALFRRETILRFISYFKQLVTSILAGPNAKISHLEIVPAAEKELLLTEFNDTAHDFPIDKTVPALIDEQAVKTPCAIALAGEDQPGNSSGMAYLTYEELNRRSDTLAAELSSLGISGEAIAAIKMESSIAMTVCMLGVMKAGGAYLPIDPAYPQDRIDYIIEDSRALLMISAQGIETYGSGSPGHGARTPDSAGLAYVIYTSGSTGKPKGVAIEHLSFINMCTWHNRRFSVSPADRALKYAGVGFDASVWEIYPPLIAGARLYLPAEETKLNYNTLAAFIDKHLISYAFLPTQVCEQFMDIEIRSLRLLHTAGDKLKRWRPTPYQLVNNYGPTENTVVASSFEVTRQYHNIPIGKPSGNSQIYILDANHRLQPIGVPGELCIGGQGLARGYLNKPELSAEKFIRGEAIGSGPSSGPRVYKTGDLARWLPDGNLEFLGRLDFQVKIRGFRIELGEIEYLLNLREEVKEAVVISRETGAGDKYLCAYAAYVAAPIGESQWREYLTGHLPDYMVPAYFVTLDKLPLTANGKVDLRALPTPVMRNNVQKHKPVSRLEKEIASLWSELLEIPEESLDREANFFHLGGHSLKATVLASRLSKALNIEFSMSHVFSGPTIKEMARFIKRSRERKDKSIGIVEQKEYFPQSPAQKRIYILEQGENTGTAYHMPLLLEIIGEFPNEEEKERLKQRLEMIFLMLIHRHEILCTSFHLMGNEPIQKVHSLVDFIVETDKDPGSTPFASVIDSFIRPFSMDEAPLLRAGLVRRDTANPLLALDIHHIVGDGVSTAILAEEFLKIYNGEDLPSLTFSYKDFACWQNRWQRNGSMNDQLSYWLDRFDNGASIPSLNLPVDFPRPGSFDFHGGSVEFKLDRGDTGAFIATGMEIEKGVTLFMNILAAFNVMLYKYTGQTEIVIGGVAAGRTHNEVQRMVGVFVNTLPLLNRIDASKSYMDFLESARSHCLDAFEHQDVPFDTLVEKLNFQREPSRNPLFDVFLSVRDFQDSGMAMKVGHQIRTDDGVVFSLCDWETPGAKFDLSLDAELTDNGIEFSLEYYSRIFKHSTVERMARHLLDTIRAVTRSPRTPLEQLDILSREEKRKILFQFNDTAGEYPNFMTLHGLFEDRAAWVADRIAVSGNKNGRLFQLTYKELNLRASELAARLKQEGINPGDIVVVSMEPSVEIMTAVLAVLKTGAAYLPIAPDTPKERIAYMLADSKAGCMIGIETDKTPDQGNNGLSIQRLAISGQHRGQHRPAHTAHPCDPGNTAYIIYTSGTTGKPKGVMVEHRSFVNRINWIQKRFQFDRHDVVLQKTAISFDVSMCEFFRWIPGGGRMFILENKGRKDLKRIIQAIEIHRVSVCEFIPSLLNLFLDHLIEENQWPRVRSLRWVLVGAEAISPVVAEKFNITLKRQFGTRLINAYGPTEATVDVTQFDCSNLESAHITSTPIGWPVQNTRIYILGSRGQIQPLGIAGELCIAGETLARGYLNNPALTHEKFTHIDGYCEHIDRFSSRFLKGTARIYRTGDLARWLPNGAIEFMGRIDRQVKLRGFRIELGEIEAQLLTHPSINDSYVIPRKIAQTQSLCAYLVSLEKKQPTPMEIKLHLSRRLPVYMIPAYFILLDRLPRTVNGKIDESALPRPAPAAMVKTYRPPRNSEEKTLLTVWARVLAQDPATIGIDDGFFDLGGDSLKVIQLCSQLRQTGIQVNVDTIYSHQTISSLSAYLESSRRGAPPKGIKDLFTGTENGGPDLAESFVPHEIQADLERLMEKNRLLGKLLTDNSVLREYPVSPVQLSSLLLSDHRGLERHNLVTLYPFNCLESNKDKGERTEIEELKKVISQLVRENSLLRSVLVRSGENRDPDYSIREFASFTNMPLPYMDLSGYAPKAKFKLLNIVRKQLTRPLKLIEHPLYRIAALKWDHHMYKVVFAVNHLIFDGGSSRLLPEKITDIRQRLHSGYKKSEDEDTATGYYDYCSFMNRINYRHIHLEPYINIDHYKNNIIRANKFFHRCSSQDGGFELSLSGMKPRLTDFYNEILLLAYSRTIAELFHTNPAPISSISYGRHYRGGNFGNIIGDFHDFIPVFIPNHETLPHSNLKKPAPVRKLIRQFLDFKKYINDSNLSFISYFVSDQETRKEVKHLISPFSFNSLIGLYEEVAGPYTHSQDENEESGSSDHLNNLRPRYFDLEMVRDPNSERLWISLHHNSIFSVHYIRKVFFRQFDHLVEEGNRNTADFLP